MIQQFQFWVFIRRNKNTNSKRYLHPYVHRNIIHNSQNMETTSVSIDGRMDKDMVYIQWNISHKKEWDLAICDNMERP